MPQQHSEATNGLVTAGYVTGVLLAPVGFFVGLVLLLKNRTGHGIAVMVIAVLVTASLSMTVLDGSSDSVMFELQPAATGQPVSRSECIDQAESNDAVVACFDEPR